MLPENTHDDKSAELPSGEYPGLKQERPWKPRKRYQLAFSGKWQEEIGIANIKHIDHKKVRQLIEDLNNRAVLLEQSKNERDKNTKVFATIFTGGTISMKRKQSRAKDEPGDLDTDSIDPIEVIERAGGRLVAEFDTAGVEFRELIDSCEMTPSKCSDIKLLNQLIWANAGPALKKRFVGTLVLHGTDTICDSASYVKNMLGAPDYPVIFVGAKRAMDDPMPDCNAQLEMAIRMLRFTTEEGMPDTYISAREGLLNPHTVFKTRDGRFLCPNHLPVVDYDKLRAGTRSGINLEHVAKINNATRKRLAGQMPAISLRDRPPVLQIPKMMAGNLEALEAQILAVKGKVIAILLETFQTGTISDEVADVVQRCAEKIKALVCVINSIPGESVKGDYAAARKLRRTRKFIITEGQMAHSLISEIHIYRQVYGRRRALIRKALTRWDLSGGKPSSWHPPQRKRAGKPGNKGKAVKARVQELYGIPTSFVKRAPKKRDPAAI